MFTFGQFPPYQSDRQFELGVSEDKRALTLTFSDLQIAVGGHAIAPTATQVFSLILPLEGDDEHVEIEFTVQGFILGLEGTTATLMCSVNGQTTVSDFAGSTDQSFVQKLHFTAEAPPEARLCIVLVLGRDSNNANAEAQLSIESFDAEILPRPK